MTQQTAAPTYRTITARFDSKCFECGRDIWTGDRIDWSKDAPRGKKTRHHDCKATARQREEGRRQFEKDQAEKRRQVQEAAEQAEREQQEQEEAERHLPSAEIRQLIDDNEAWFEGFRRCPPTMDYMVEFTREMAEAGRRRAQTERLERILASRLKAVA